MSGKGFGSPNGKGNGIGQYSVSKNPMKAPQRGSSLRSGTFSSEGNKVNSQMKRQAAKESNRGRL